MDNYLVKLLKRNTAHYSKISDVARLVLILVL